MTITYSWLLQKLKTKTVDSNENVVCKVEYKYKGVDEAGNCVMIPGEVDLDTSNLSSFVSYEQLSQDQITSWVVSTLGASNIDTMNDYISAEIASKILIAEAEANASQEFNEPEMPWMLSSESANTA